MYDTIQADLRDLENRGRLRSLRGRAGIDFTSNDYLGLAESAELRQAAAAAIARGVPVGAGGAPPLRGDHPPHQRREGGGAGPFRAPAPPLFPPRLTPTFS